MRKRILFLNPPSKEPVFRDCYCSGKSKFGCYIQPLDLQIQSGFFNEKEFESDYIDAVLENLNSAETIKKAATFKPDIVLSLIGEAALDNDILFFKELKKYLPDIVLFLSGDIVKFGFKNIEDRIPEADGILTDFSENQINRFLQNGRNNKDGPNAQNHPITNFDGKKLTYPNPGRRLVNKYSYKLPFFPSPRYYSVLSSYGCPYNCGYCNTHMLGYKERDADEFIEELKYAASLGFKSLYVRDATFMVNKDRTEELFAKWNGINKKFGWICFTRPDLLCEELVKKASHLGCTLIMVGVESYDKHFLNNMKRHVDENKIFTSINLLRKYNIQSAAHFILGMGDFPNSCGKHDATEIYYRSLLRFVNRIAPDYISLNVLHKRPGVELVDDKYFEYIKNNSEKFDKIKDRLTFQYYFNKRQIFRKIRSVKSFAQFLLWLKIALKIL